MRILFLVLLLATSKSFAEELLFAMEPDFPPFNYSEYEEITGSSVEIVQATCKHMKVNCKIESPPWIQGLEDTKNGKYNALFTIAWNSERSNWFYYSEPLMETEYGFFELGSTTKSIKKYSSMYQLQGKKIIAYGPSNTTKKLTSLQERATAQGILFEVIQTTDTREAIRYLIDNKGDIIFSNRDVLKGILEYDNVKEKIDYLGPGFPPNHYYIGFSKKKEGNTEIFKRFNKAYNELLKQGTIQEILNKYQQTLGLHDLGRVHTATFE